MSHMLTFLTPVGRDYRRALEARLQSLPGHSTITIGAERDDPECVARLGWTVQVCGDRFVAATRLQADARSPEQFAAELVSVLFRDASPEDAAAELGPGRP